MGNMKTGGKKRILCECIAGTWGIAIIARD